MKGKRSDMAAREIEKKGVPPNKPTSRHYFAIARVNRQIAEAS